MNSEHVSQDMEMEEEKGIMVHRVWLTAGIEN